MDVQRGMLLLWVSVVLAFGLDSVVACKEVDRSPTKIIIFCEGVEWWKIQHLFVPRIISTSCPSKVVLEYGKLSTPYLQTRGCGSYIAQWAKQPAPNDLQCLAETSPFETGMIVAKASSGKVDECQLQGSFMFTPDRFGMFVVGFLLFFMAGGLATNSHVRIAVGTILIAALGVTMMAVWIAGRAVSNRSMFTTYIFITMASFAGTAVTFLGPAWLKVTMLENGFLAYTVIMGLIGWMVSYCYDDPNNTRRNTVYVVVARVVASAAIWYSASDKIGGAVLVALVWANRLLISGALPVLSSTVSVGAAAVSSMQKSHPRRGRRIDKIDETRAFGGRNGVHAVSKGDWCDLCKAGMIVDRKTNCKIRMPGLAFDNLVREGAVPDFVNGYV